MACVTRVGRLLVGISVSQIECRFGMHPTHICWHYQGESGVLEELKREVPPSLAAVFYRCSTTERH
jgi:hypothetical protein